MKSACALLATTSLLFLNASCDTHSFDETKVLHEGMHGAHGAGHESAAPHEGAAAEGQKEEHKAH